MSSDDETAGGNGDEIDEAGYEESSSEQAVTEADTESNGGILAAGIEDAPGFDPTVVLEALEDYAEVVSTTPYVSLEEPGEEEYEFAEDVCGVDNRVRISPATAVPWRWNCQLIIKKHDGNYSRCTGWFIGPHTVMTAGHCVYSHAVGGWAQQIEVIPGKDGANQPFGSLKSSSFKSVVGWTISKKPDYDYGSIILPSNGLGNLVGKFGFDSLADGQLLNLLVNNAGYPGDKPFGTLWFNASQITQVTATRLGYLVDTFGGQSGSCIWRYTPADGKRTAVGIHGYGGCSVPGGTNKAVRITPAVKTNMVNWLA